MTRDRETAIEIFRQAVLRALDGAVDECFGPVGRNDRGATDADLPRLFKAIDAQVDVLCDRFDIVLTSYDPAAIERAAAELRQARGQ